MKLKFSDKNEFNPEFKNSDVKLSVGDILLDTSELLEFYQKKDLDSIYERIKSMTFVDFQNDLNTIRTYKNIHPIKDLTDASASGLLNQYKSIRIAINECLGMKHRFMDYKRVWTETIMIVESILERQKDYLFTVPEIRDLKNKESRISEVNTKMDNMISSFHKLKVIMTRFKQMEDEIKETLEYLKDVKDENSRIQSLVVIAFDTGELVKTNYNRN